MTQLQQSIVILFCIYSFIGFFHGVNKCRQKNSYGISHFYLPLGAFVWIDAVIISAFWIITSLCSLLLNDWFLFLLIVSLFWIVRSCGEILYWIHEQFATIHLNKPKDLYLSRFFEGDSVWVAYQLFWQCFLVLDLFFLVYLIK